MKIKAYIKCIIKALLKFIIGVPTLLLIGYVICFLPVQICYKYYDMKGIGLGLVISVLICILLAIIETEITEYKRWNDD